MEEAQQILDELGLPPAQQNEISALTLLVLADLGEDDDWPAAQNPMLRIHDILLNMHSRFGRLYAENTRETIRRQVLHQFIQAGIVVRNPGDPTLATNSPRTHYALSELALSTIRAFASAEWPAAVQAFLDSRGALLERYQRQREMAKVPVSYQGETFRLSPGPHNELQAAVLAEFGPRFAPGTRLLYLGDTANKRLVIDESGFAALGLDVPGHDKLPDIMLFDEQRRRLFLVEAVTSHGPVSGKRQIEFLDVFGRVDVRLILVTAFPDFRTFKAYAAEIAWETEVWIAEVPDHLIHFDGERFLPDN
jgi:hypothetical protein